jgi:UDP-N-acetylglucosamine 2-epimerase
LKIKVTTVLGTRPELIRMGQILKKFDEVFDHRMIHTGQNNDDNLKDVFFRDLGIRKPDLQFDMRSSSLGKSFGILFETMSSEFENNRPEALVILGDTNSALCGILAKRLKIPFYHLEAGLRSFDKNVPEEINRRIIDHTADFNLVYTELARQNLLDEGLHTRSIALVGSPLREVLNSSTLKIESSKILEMLQLKKDKFYLVSVHRQENVDDEDRLVRLMDSLVMLTEKTNLPIIFSTHPRTKERIQKMGFVAHQKIKFCEPFGFNDYCKLQLSAKLVLSDSGSVSEEASMLGFKAITLRDSMERPEALESGSIVMSGINSDRLLETVKFVENAPVAAFPPTEYSIADTSERVVKLILSTLPEYHFWFGIRK